MIRWNYQLTKQNWLVCAVGIFLLFNRFLFQNLRSGPKGYRAFRETGPWSVILRGLSNDDDDGKENGKQPIGLDWQNNNFASASRFFVHFNFTFCPGREHKTTTCFFFFWTLLQLFRIQLQKKKIANIWRNWMSWNKRDKVWSSANSYFNRLFLSRRRRCCFSSLFYP